MMSQGQQLNRYERAMMRNLSVMKYLFLAIVLMNMFMPIISPTRMGFTVLLQYIVLVIHSLNLLNGIGVFLGQKVHLVKIIILRVVEVLFYLYFDDINWIPFGMLLALDFAFFYILYTDKMQYGYKKVKVSTLD